MGRITADNSKVKMDKVLVLGRNMFLNILWFFQIAKLEVDYIPLGTGFEMCKFSNLIHFTTKIGLEEVPYTKEYLLGFLGDIVLQVQAS